MNCSTLLKTVSAALVTTFVLSQTALGTPQKKLEPAKLFSARNGLPNVAKKLKNNEDVTLVFLGGSITQGGGKNGYVYNVTEWFKKNYPKSKIKGINAGIGGTGSDFGVKRYDRDVLKHKPDLVLIEFAVNDGTRDRTKEMERMIHKTWLKNPETDIIIFYTLHQRHLTDYKKGKLPFSASCHERVAEFYKVPSVGCAFNAAKQLSEGKLKWEEFSRDSCHPKPKGYAAFNDAFKQALPEMLKTGKAGPHKLAGSITPNLQVYPPKIDVKPQNIEPFVDKNGKKAVKSFQLPVVGVNWVSNPDFQDKSGKTIWRLCYFNYRKPKTADALPKVGINKAKWDNKPMIWFEEDKSFTGARGTALVKRSGKDANSLGNAANELGVVVFVAPETGKYVIKTSAQKIGMWRNDDKSYCINMLLFDWKKAEGQALAFAEEVKKDNKGFEIEKELNLMAGEQVAFIPVPGLNLAGWMRASWAGFTVKVGYYGKK